MTSIINENSFTASETQPDHGYWIDGTVEVTLRGETQVVPAKMSTDRYKEITAYGMTGRYNTGSKAWAAKATQRTDPSNGKKWDYIQFGRDDRSGKFNKVNCVWFAE